MKRFISPLIMILVLFAGMSVRNVALADEVTDPALRGEIIAAIGEDEDTDLLILEERLCFGCGVKNYYVQAKTDDYRNVRAWYLEKPRKSGRARVIAYFRELNEAIIDTRGTGTYAYLDVTRYDTATDEYVTCMFVYEGEPGIGEYRPVEEWY